MDVATTAPRTTTTTPGKTQVNSDYDTFLKMMTTQIKNQDPLSPMDSAQFALQLATFSSVEQQTKTNDLLTSQLAAMNQSNMAQMSGWVGKEVRVEAPAYFDGTTPITLSPNPAIDADRAVLVVTDASGDEVARQDMTVGSADYQWTGLDADGNPMAEGVYSFSLESYKGDTLLGSTGVEYYGAVAEIRSGGSGVTVMLPGGVEVPTSYVTALREPV